MSLAPIRSALEQEKRAGAYEIEIAAGENGVAIEPGGSAHEARPVERRLRGATYRFSASTFFQGNAFLLDALIESAVRDYAGELAVNLYAGVGLFTIQLADRFNKVIGVEADRNAAMFARENISINNRSNIDFRNTTVKSWLMTATSGSAKPRPDLLLLDPPRAGAAEAIPHIIEMSPAQISYVSCDPNTLARDLRKLIDAGYELTRVTALDLFPQTYHVETVASLRRV